MEDCACGSTRKEVSGAGGEGFEKVGPDGTPTGEPSRADEKGLVARCDAPPSGASWPRFVLTAVLALLRALLSALLHAARANPRPLLAAPPSPTPPPPSAACDGVEDDPAIAPEDGLPPEHLLEHTADSLAARVSARLGRGGSLARAVYREYCGGGGACGWAEEVRRAARPLAARVRGLCDTTPPLALEAGAAPPAAGETEKYVLRAADGAEVEMVAMPAPGVEAGWSLCVSTQVGCRMGCTFCETGRMGLLRNLTVAEVVAQLAVARFALRLRVANVVFMGMGEPLDNVDVLIRSIRVMIDPLGFCLPLKNITVSTSGEAKNVYTLVDALPSVRMAFSIHSGDEAMRSRLMPINRRVPLAEFAEAMRYYLRKTKRRITIQYVLLAGENDSASEAATLAAFLRTVGPAARFHVNLIPYNEQSKPRYRTPSHQACVAFKVALMQEGYFAKIRETRGDAKMAACGQVLPARLEFKSSCTHVPAVIIS
ncbi:hypothetical protein AB1Y20_007374 [Prymnesium parvum]|uniref:Radical SAM core domain-containing protein n=1 Tax=Prymnesium parvum TaxID=97485 RepID=A0AB34IVX7_PRYPA